jgi:putative 4-mercaptohistidine N1-methyltranferase
MQTATPPAPPSQNSCSPASNPYESERLLNEYLLFHFGLPEEILPESVGPRESLGYPVRCVQECVDATTAHDGTALDLGCAVGRSTFELARICRQVVGIDYSQTFLDAAEQVRVHGNLAYFRSDEGDLCTPLIARLPKGVDPQRVRFEQGDAMALRPDLGSFEVVLMANLIDRLRSPKSCLERLKDLVNPGGQLVLTSPYTWMPEYTPRDNSLGGFELHGQRCVTLDGLKSVLSSAFELTGVRDLPFLIREHARKFQWSVAQASVWRRKC